LHLGHVASALLVWVIAKSRQHKIILRIEDHDFQRNKKKFEQSILEDLSYLGFNADLGVRSSTDKSQYRQSDHNLDYQQAVTILQKTEHIYYCSCSRKDIQSEMNHLGQSAHPELCYPGTCRHKNLINPAGAGLRIQFRDIPQSFNDLLLGNQKQRPLSQCGDLLLMDKKENWSYHFANVVDDLRDKVTLIVRGQDILDSTGRQIQLRKMISNIESPQYLHHPLLLEANEPVKLSKRNHSDSISERIAKGDSADSIIGDAAYEVGLTEKKGQHSLSDITELLMNALSDV
jgi:glutamyl-tRNA synthetase/glutamyl-Q tRNA(Asp) synthetase